LNQAILFNDDFIFDEQQSTWKCSALLSGQVVTIYYQVTQGNNESTIDSHTRFDLEEAVECWLEHHEPDNDEIHITSDDAN